MERISPENLSKEEEYAIIQEILGGRINLFEKLQHKYKKPLTILISRMIRDSEDVRDIVQETFIRAFNNLKFYKKEYSFHSWLFKIASNLCIDYLRKKRLQKFSIEQPYPTGDDDRQFDYPDVDADTYTKIFTEERDKILRTAISMLPENYQKVITMRHFEDMDYKEIAEKLSLPLGTVKVHLFRARKALLEILKSMRFDFQP
jgi:RNA polymerase sigma-70 factor (ECF subfamily)